MSLKQLPDHELIKRYQAGQQQAYNALFCRYAESVYRYTMKHIRNHSVAEELAMDVMFRFWQKFDTLPADTNIPAYLFTAAKNALADHWRRKELATVSLLDENILLQSRPADYRLATKEYEYMYERTVDKLSPQCREVFVLSREQGMTYQEIAREMNLSVNTVKSYMATALKGIRTTLQHQTDHTLIITLLFLTVR